MYLIPLQGYIKCG